MREDGDVEKAFAEADEIVEQQYGLAMITHCCLEAHGQVTEMKGDVLHVWPSTQNVSFEETLKLRSQLVCKYSRLQWLSF